MRRCALLASRSPRRSARRSRRSSPGSAGGCTSAPRRSRSRPASCSSRSPRRPRRRIGSAIYVVSALLVFTVSAIYHCGRWSPRTHGYLKRFDHANIFLLIAGTYTPFTLLLLEGAQRTDPAQRHLVGGRARRALQGVLDQLASLALPADLHRHGLGGGLLRPRLRRGLARPARRRHRHGRPGAGDRRRRALHAGRGRLRLQAARTPGRAGSASTRSSTPSRSWRS